MSDTESDIEMKSALPKKLKKPAPRSPSDDLKNNNKKISTKMMIIDALTELKTRKGVSLYAIKKHLTEKYNVNTEKVNYLIKKSIKAGVEDGTFIQMKGVGASGSFKLANVKEKPKKKKKAEKIEKMEKKPEKITDKQTKAAKKPKKTESKKSENVDEKKEKEKKPKKNVEVSKKEKKPKKVLSENEEGKKKKAKIAKGMQTPAKKRAAMMKRKSIGSIIKPPKMKPKSKA